jgi:ribose transport system substrate-binding protein
MRLPPGWKSLVTAVGVFVLFTSCQPAYHSKSERYVFICANCSLPYWQDAKSGFTAAAREMGVKVQFAGPAAYSPQQELKAFQSAIATRPSGIIVSPAQADLFKPAIDRAVQQGIPVICLDSDSPDSRRMLFIGTDNYAAGVAIGKLMAGLMHQHGRIVLITIPGQFNLDERLRGVEDALKPYPYMNFYQIDNDNGVTQVAEQEVASLLQRNADIGGILCLEASGGPGAAEAVDRYGAEGRVTIVAMDANPDTLDWIAKGVITATVAQKPYTMAFYSLRFADDLHHNVVREFKNWEDAPASPLPSFVDTGTEVINRDNLDDYRSALAAAQ